jgi:1,4-alpha-glucan branching enzyme
LLHADGHVDMVSGGDVLDIDPAKHLITLPEGCWGEGGYHTIWLNQDNVWTWEKLYDVERKMRKMSREWAGGAADEIIRQAAREMLLAEASDWQFLISTFAAKDYAEIRFSDHIDRFLALHKMAERVFGGGELTTKEQEFLLECQQKDAPFADLDITMWANNPETGPAIQ